MRKTMRGRIYVSAIGMVCIIPALFGVGNAATLSIAVAFLVLFGIGWGFFDCNNMPILCQIARPELRGDRLWDYEFGQHQLWWLC